MLRIATHTPPMSSDRATRADRSQLVSAPASSPVSAYLYQSESPRGAQPLPGCRTRLASQSVCADRCGRSAPPRSQVAALSGASTWDPLPARRLVARGSESQSSVSDGSQVEFPTTDTVAGIGPAFRSRERKDVKGNSGRFTAPMVEELELFAKENWVESWGDGELTQEEETRIARIERLTVIAKLVDVTEEARNAMSGRNGIGSPHAGRRYRELRKRWDVLQGGLDAPRPAGPAAAKRQAALGSNREAA